MRRICLLLMIQSAFSFPVAFAQTTVPINPRASYLRMNEDPLALNAAPISLDAMGIRPGDTITLRILGDLSYCTDCEWPGEYPVWLAGGVFSSSSVLLRANNLNRVPGAQPIQQGNWIPCESWNTLLGDLSTNIPEDFGFSSFETATVRVPSGAHWLFVAVVDSFYGDNSDPNADLAVEIEKTLVAIPLNALWRVVPWEPNRMTSPGVEEWSQFPSEGQIFYVAGDFLEPGTKPLNRFNNGFDHRDSTLAELPDYSFEGALGFGWTSKSLPGLSPMVEGFNPETSDYALMQPGEQLSGYTTESLGVFGYKRYYNQQESILTLTKDNTTVESNRVFGGIVWRWTWKGTQFLSNLPYWAFGVKGGITTLIALDIDGTYRQMNEGGDGNPHGSPLVRAENSQDTHVTRAIPLDSTTYTADNPFLWRDATLGKDLTLSFGGIDGVAKFVSYVSLPSSIPNADLYRPIVSFRSPFNHFFVYHADSDFLEEVTSLVQTPESCSWGYRFGALLTVGGGVVSDSTGDNAFAIYADNSSSPVNTYAEFGNYTCWGDESLDFSVLDLDQSGPLPAGESTYNSYVVTGTLAEVKAKMRQLFLTGVK